MADWIEPTIVLFPFAAWLFLGVGIPWALALLPREDWRARGTVIAVGLAIGPLAVTAWMFALGTWGRITLGGTLAGSAAAIKRAQSTVEKLVTCSKCGAQAVWLFKQNRSADEGMSVIYSCVRCKSTWG